jgi:hypothetical protein
LELEHDLCQRNGWYKITIEPRGNRTIVGELECVFF